VRQRDAQVCSEEIAGGPLEGFVWTHSRRHLVLTEPLADDKRRYVTTGDSGPDCEEDCRVRR